MSDDLAQLSEPRDAFLKRIRASLSDQPRGGDQPPVPPAVDESIARLASTNDDLAALFRQRAEEVGMVVHVTSKDAAADRAIKILGSLEAKTALCSEGGTLEELGLPGKLEAFGIGCIDWRGQTGPNLAGQWQADAGITDVAAAVAETGSLICQSSPAHSRGLSLVPLAHVALVKASDIVPDLLDYFASVNGKSGGELPASQAIITGPSKTADIEGEMVTGVHGPGQVHIVLIEDA